MSQPLGHVARCKPRPVIERRALHLLPARAAAGAPARRTFTFEGSALELNSAEKEAIVTEFHVNVVRIGAINKHPNADTLSITHVHGGYPCIVRTGELAEGDLAVYIPVDSMVPVDVPRFSFLAPKGASITAGDKTRIKAKRLRGIFSMGLLVPPDADWTQGMDVAERLGITKYEPTEAEPDVADEADPGTMPPYTDIEGLRRWQDVFVTGEEVIATEKIHGENFRAMHDGTRLWVGSRTRIKRASTESKWWQAARSAGLEERLAQFPGIVVYGESHGYTGGFPYGSDKRATQLRIFDAMDSKTRTYFDVDAFFDLAGKIGVPTVPVLYRGPFTLEALTNLAEGQSTLDKTHVREGFVVRPVHERHDDRVGRVILKMHGEGFLVRA
jgi:RNA ligase (TIGR02306 family)